MLWDAADRQEADSFSACIYSSQMPSITTVNIPASQRIKWQRNRVQVMTENDRSRRFGRSRKLAEYAQLPTFGRQAQAELRSTTIYLRYRPL